jgi:hypothetical protein
MVEWKANTLTCWRGAGGFQNEEVDVRKYRPFLRDSRNSSPARLNNDSYFSNAVSILDAINEQASLRAPIPRSVFQDFKNEFLASQALTPGLCFLLYCTGFTLPVCVCRMGE